MKCNTTNSNSNLKKGTQHNLCYKTQWNFNEGNTHMVVKQEQNARQPINGSTRKNTTQMIAQHVHNTNDSTTGTQHKW